MRMNDPIINCVLLADRHHGLSEAIRGLLETTFEAVVMVADQTSLLESVKRLQPTLAVVDLSLAREENFRWLQKLRGSYPKMKLIVLSVHDEPSVLRTTMEAGADGFVVKRHIATELLPAVDAVLAGQSYISPGVGSTDGDNKGIAKPEEKR